ncbi:MAG: hypothetical protein ACREMC_03805 [Gemmatimonadales bacterium]
MRVLTVVLALVAIPFVAGVSQAPFQDPKNCGVHLTSAQNANARAGRASVLAHDGKHGVMDLPCGSAETPTDETPTGDTPTGDTPTGDTAPPACAVSVPAATGPWTIDGRVSDATDPWAPLALKGWCIQLTGSVTATVMTGDDGRYLFSGLPEGTYTICEVLQSGYQQSFPTLAWGATPCPNGTLGWTYVLTSFSGSGSFFDFRNTVVAP